MRLRHVALMGLLGLTLAGAPMFTPVVRADDATAPAPKHKHGSQVDRLQAALDKLNLTADQKTKIDPLVADARTKIKAANADANGDKDAIKAKVGPIMKELSTNILAVLTPDQQEEFKKATAHHKPTTKPASN